MYLIMNKLFSSFLFSVYFLANTYAQSNYIFKNVNVVNPTGEVLKNQIVTVKDGRIVFIGKNYVASNFIIIDGKGNYLCPGLANMHVHLPTTVDSSVIQDYFWLNLANGITFLRSMRGNEQHLYWRKAALEKKLIAPDLYLSAPALWRDTTFSYQKALSKLKVYKESGYDCVKYLSGLSALRFDSLMLAGREAGIPVVGHVPMSGLMGSIKNNQKTIEHLTPFLTAYQQDSTVLESYFEQMRDKQLNVCPTLLFYQISWDQIPVPDLKEMKGIAYMPKATRVQWNKDLDAYDTNDIAPNLIKYETEKAESKRKLDTFNRLLRRMARVGVPVLIGSDDGIGIVPGFGFHDEIALYQKAGFTPVEILRFATTNAAQCVDSNDWGEIAIGKKAHFLLLSQNPLTDSKNLRTIEGVMIGQNWLPKQRIETELARIKKKNAF
jgi:hypothetical protein